MRLESNVLHLVHVRSDQLVFFLLGCFGCCVLPNYLCFDVAWLLPISDIVLPSSSV